MDIRRSLSLLCALGMLALGSNAQAGQNERVEKIRNDRARFEKSAYWTYNDLDLGLAEAAKTKKPLLIVFRCVP